jgi:hypothetical protein
MKKLIITVIICIVCEIQPAGACEICGCGVGNFYMGMVPKFNSKFIGLRYRYIGFSSQVKNSMSEFSRDTYQSLELWSGWKLGKKWQAMIFIPYQYNIRITNEGEKKSNGLGDITLLTNYRLINQPIGHGNQQLLIGGGIKVPSGAYKIDFTDPKINLGDPNAKAGTGSVDLLFNINHNISIQQWGINTMVSYKANSANQENYKFGNRLSANSLAYYRFKFKTMGIAPVIGGLYELSAPNYFQHERIEQTGGYAAFGLAGLEMNYSKVAFGLNVQAPLKQNLSQTQTQAKPRGLVHLTFTL